jgi:hypothetical protein
MSHQVIIIRGNVDTGQREVEVTYTPPDEMSGDDAREEATKWSKWVKKQYNYVDVPDDT